MLFKSTKKIFAEVVARESAKGWPPLCAAAAAQDRAKALDLIGSGADIEARDFYKQRTPLHWAAGGDTETALTLIARGADIHARDGSDETPLHIAMRTGRGEIALALLHQGAELAVKDFQGDTPLQAAVSYGGPAIQESMREIISLHYGSRVKAMRVQRPKYKTPRPGA